MKRKKLFALILTAAMFFSSGISVLASASPSRKADVSYADASGDYVIENGKLTQYKGAGGDVVIPNAVSSV